MNSPLTPEPDGVTPDDINDAAPVERRLLAAILNGGGGADVVDAVAAIVTAADFALDAHVAVYEAALALNEAGEPATLDGVFRHLRRTGRAADLGANPGLWLAELFEDRGPIGAYAATWARKVADLATRRRLKRAAVSLFREADAPGPVADVAARCEQLLFEVSDPAAATDGGPKAMQDAVPEGMNRIDDRVASGGVLAGLSTGLHGLDDYLSGLKPGQLVVVGARPGVGKTGLALRISLANTSAGLPTLFVSAEMPAGEIIDRALSQRSGVPLQAIQSGRINSAYAEKLTDAGRQLAGEPLYLDDTPGLTATRVASVLRRAVRRRRVGLAVVDYLQLLIPDNPRDNRTLQVGAMARTLKLAARACGVPVVLLCQLNREVEGRGGGRPRLSDLRDSGEIEQHADTVVLLHVQPDQGIELDTWKVDAIVAKNRNGPIGESTLDYIRPILRFEQSPK